MKDSWSSRDLKVVSVGCGKRDHNLVICQREVSSLNYGVPYKIVLHP